MRMAQNDLTLSPKVSDSNGTHTLFIRYGYHEIYLK